VYADSDVDIVLKHDGAHFYDLTELKPQEVERYKRVHTSKVDYGYSEFKAQAEEYIKRLYNGVQSGKKALHIPGNQKPPQR
jgi:hypothetical protein